MPTSYLRRLEARVVGVKVSADSEQVPVIGADIEQKIPLDAAAITPWQLNHHKDFVYSSIDTSVHWPPMNQHANWRKLCDMIRGASTEVSFAVQRNRLFNGKILVIFGDEDRLVVEEEVSVDLLQMLGEPQYTDIRVVIGGHGFP